jgi:calcineurin-like phosphoesterase family protein
MNLHKVFWVADYHFGHANIIKFCQRPFSNVDEMDREMTRRHNEVVDPNDWVYSLGDFTLGPDAMRYLSHLNGRWRFIVAGHDKRWAKKFPWAEGLYERLEPIHEISLGRNNLPPKLVLSHYPLLTWEASFHGSWNLHGHNHMQSDPVAIAYDDRETSTAGKRINVGVDYWDFYPQTLDMMGLT